MSGTLKPLRGSKRGAVLTGIIKGRLMEHGFATLQDAVRDFNRRYTSPMADHNARLIFSQLVTDGILRKVAPGAYVSPRPRDGALLPILEAVSPTARIVWEAVNASYPEGVGTTEIPEIVKEAGGPALTLPQVYSAFKLLEKQGILRWTHGFAKAARGVIGRSDLLSGGKALDIRGTYDPKSLPPMREETAEERTADDDVIDPMDEATDDAGPALVVVDPFS